MKDFFRNVIDKIAIGIWYILFPVAIVVGVCWGAFCKMFKK